MSKPEPLQQIRESLRSFRKATAQRQRQEADADARLKAEQKQADETLNRARQEAETLRARSESEATRRYQTDRQAADATLAQAQQIANARLQQTEADIATRYRAEHQAADVALTKAQQDADKQLQRAKVGMTASYEVACQTAETARQQMLAQAEVALETADRSLGDPRWELQSVDLYHLIPSQVTPAESDIPAQDGSLAPAQALTESSQMAANAAREAAEAARALQQWRKTRRRRRNWILGLAAAALGILLIAFGVRATQQAAASAAARATAVAQVTATAGAVVSSTAVARNTGTAIAQAAGTAQVNATAAEQVEARITDQALATTTAQAQASIEARNTMQAQANATATAQALPTVTATSTPTWTPSPSPTPQPDAIVSSPTLNLREKPSTESTVLASYSQGTVLKVVGRTVTGEWVKVETTDGRAGWMSTQLLQLNVALWGLRVFSITIQVRSDTGWQNTQMVIYDDEIVVIEYLSGMWSMCAPNGCPYYDANGVPDTPDYLDNTMTGCNHAALIAKVSNTSPFCVGNGVSGRVGRNGNLQLGINDNVTGDNGGSIVVRIEVK